MTTIDAAAARHLRKRVALAALASFLAAGVGACSTNSNLLGSSGDEAQVLSQQTAVQPAPAPSRITIAPVIGAPEAVGKQLTAQLTQDLEQKSVSVAKAPTDRADFTLRGYIVAAREKTGTKVSYIWDVADPTGKRVNRITGEELAGGTDSRDPWAAVTPAVMQSITSKTATSLGAWMQSQSAVASAAQPVQTAALPGTPANAAPVQTPPDATTGSIGRNGAVTALVPSVTGAPGDGSVSLTSALQRELSRSGIALADRAADGTYRVEGKVKVGQSKDGKQPIQIDWHVKDPHGKQLGTVSQKNEIPQGSLDGSWGKVADAAAAAAAQGILKLLPAKSVN
ncbi:MAG: hypothetical protein KJZ80_06945 [Hyphomicrobiaceae bacterium]|nr:hypothetical protein [Hyphomicrobiaceae bacterium]